MTHTSLLLQWYILSAKLTSDLKEEQKQRDWQEAPAATQVRDDGGYAQGSHRVNKKWWG